MIVKRALLALPVLAAMTVGADAQKSPVGRYTVEGRGPDGSTYTGTAEVAQTGETFRVTWVIGGERFVGTAIGDNQFMSISYRSGSDTGLALLVSEGTGWLGVWTYAGGTRLGQERWARR